MNNPHNPYNNQNSLNLNNLLQLFLLGNAEHDSLNNPICKRSALKTLIAPAFLLLTLGLSLYFIISNDSNLMFLVYIIIPLGLIMFLLFFLSAAKNTYIIKVSENEITKKYFLRRVVSINYADIESSEIQMPQVNNAGTYSAPALSFIKMNLIIKSFKNETIIFPVFIRGFIEFYNIFKQNFKSKAAQKALNDIMLSFMQAGIDLEAGKAFQNQEDFNGSPFDGF